jgi:hypothetical protein
LPPSQPPQPARTNESATRLAAFFITSGTREGEAWGESNDG